YIAGENAGGKFVVAGPSVRVPGARIRRAVIDKVEVGIVGYPRPGATTANLPGIGRPRLHPQVLTAILCVERLEAGADQNIFIGPGSVSSPSHLTGFGVEGLQPAAHTELSTTDTD